MYKTYKEKPKYGIAKKAWERFVKEFGLEPAEITFSPSYYGQKGWVCEFFGERRPLDGNHSRGHGSAGDYKFYSSISLR